MRLLNCHTLEFKEFGGTEIPRYLILSHRWGDDEVSHLQFMAMAEAHSQIFQNETRMRARRWMPSRFRLSLYGPAPHGSAGYKKILDFCAFARTRESTIYGVPSMTLDWVWIDTCCIDKSSSAELSEAINSMYAWYERAAECVVYLADVDTADEVCGSEWFTRGWTLQELLAPRSVVFCAQDWRVIGHSCRGYLGSDFQPRMNCMHNATRFGPNWNAELARDTNIQECYLAHTRSIYTASIARRMSWAARRRTTRLEDMAYSLLGIFRVNMPLLYGEGEGAFRRLQQELIRTSSDLSIFVWEVDTYYRPWKGLLAATPACFEKGGDIVRVCHDLAFPYSVTNRGMELRCAPSLVVDFSPGGSADSIYVIKLNCKRIGTTREEDGLDRVVILLQKDTSLQGDQYRQVSPRPMPPNWHERPLCVDPRMNQEMTFIVPDDMWDEDVYE